MTTPNRQPPRILVEIHTSGTSLSKSSSLPFSVTLKAKLVHSRPIIDKLKTVLGPCSLALDYQGLAFADTATGALAERTVIDVCRQVPAIVTAGNPGVIQLPTSESGGAYSVTHTFGRASGPAEEILEADRIEEAIEKMMPTLGDPTTGLFPGHSYKIGLGADMSEVGWWREGNKAEVFLTGSQSRHGRGDPLQMELVDKALFSVVE